MLFCVYVCSWLLLMRLGGVWLNLLLVVCRGGCVILLGCVRSSLLIWCVFLFVVLDIGGGFWF